MTHFEHDCFVKFFFLFYLLIVNINVLHYTIRNLYSVVSLNKVMLKAGKEKIKQTGTHSTA